MFTMKWWLNSARLSYFKACFKSRELYIQRKRIFRNVRRRMESYTRTPAIVEFLEPRLLLSSQALQLISSQDLPVTPSSQDLQVTQVASGVLPTNQTSPDPTGTTDPGSPTGIVSQQSALPDLQGYAGANPYYFHVLESNVTWGETIHVYFAIANFGSSASNPNQPFNVALLLSTTSTISASNYSFGEIQIASIPSGGTYIGEVVTFTLPPADPITPSTSFELGMNIDPENVVRESSKTNNLNQGANIDKTAVTISAPAIPILPDLVGYAATSPYYFHVAESSVSWGDTIHVYFAIANTGGDPKNPNQPFNLQLLLSTTSTIATTNYSLGEVQIFSTPLGAGHVTAGEVTLTLPSADPITPGTSFELGMNIDPENVVQESSKSNNLNQGVNIDKTAVTITPPAIPILPDLIGYAATSPYYFHVLESTISWGDTIHVYYAIANNGGDPSNPNQSFNLQLLLSATSTISTTNYSLGEVQFASIPLGGGHVIGGQAALTLPASNPSTLGSSFYLGMDIDPEGIVGESSKSNNLNQGVSLDKTPVTISPPAAMVTVSVAPSTSHAINFGTVVADGLGNSEVIQQVTLSDSAAKSIMKIPQNGISLASGHDFHIVNILSNQKSQLVDVKGGSSLIAANQSETWTIQIAFDPTVGGSLSDTLNILTDDPSNPSINVALSGTGTAVSHLAVADSQGNPGDKSIDFGNTGVDGVGGLAGNQTVTLTNTGTGPLKIAQNGLVLPTGPYSITSIVSSTQGAINLAGGSKSIAAGGTESWVVNLKFDPTATGLVETPLTINSDDPNNPVTVVSLIGTGVTVPTLVASKSTLAFGSIPADGTGNQLVTQTLTLSNSGQLPLVVNQNGISLTKGTQFTIGSVVSSTQGAINLAPGSQTIAANSGETWTVTVTFDPSLAGNLSDSLNVVSNAAGSPTSIPLTGTGLNQPGLLVSGTDAGQASPSLAFGATLNDGSGGAKTTRTVALTNIGTQPLIVSQNGISLQTGTNYQVVSIVSSKNGTINLSTSSASLAPVSGETWTVTVAFDPRSTGSLSDTLQIASNDPVTPATRVALSGQGVVPSVTTAAPGQAIHVSAGSVYRIGWNSSDPTGNATYSIFYGEGDIPGTYTQLVSNLPEAQATYDWHIPAGLVGGTYVIAVQMHDGSVTSSSFASGSLTVDAQGTDRLLSAPITDQSQYALSYSYNGTTYTGSYNLSPGDNILYATTGSVTHEYHVSDVPTLVVSQNATYDVLGNVTSTSNSAGQTTTYVYDQLSRLTRVNFPDESIVDYTYDASNNLMTMHDSTGWQLYNYDLLNRLSSVTYSPTKDISNPLALTLAYEHDLDNRVTALNYPSGKRVQYEYDSAGKLTSATEKNAGQPDLVTTYSYDSVNGMLVRTNRPNDTSTINTYDSNGRLIDILHRRTSKGTLILEYHYSLDNAGRQTQVVTTTPNGTTAEAYVYDDMNRLSQVSYADKSGVVTQSDQVVAYTYDSIGNRISQTTYAHGIVSGATETLTFNYGQENRLVNIINQSGVVQESYSYDNRGNQVASMTAAATTIYGYDARNLLTTVNDGMNQITYQYDGQGRRIGQTVNGVITKFVIDPSNTDYSTIEERTATGALSAAYAYGRERVSAQLPGQTSPTFYLTDAKGSVGGLADGAGNGIGVYTYDAFGATRSSPVGISNQFQFAGEWVDAVTGNLYLRARTYEPSTGRFIQRDPLGNSASTNVYAYVANDPINHVDFSGLVEGPPPYTDPNEKQTVESFVIDNLADVLTAGRGPLSKLESAITGETLPWSLGGLGPGRNAGAKEDGQVYGFVNLQAAKDWINSQPWSDSYKQGQISFATHDFAVMNSGSWFGDLTNQKIIDAHWQLAMNSPDPGIKATFGALAGIGKASQLIGDAAEAVGNGAVSLGHAALGVAGGLLDSVVNLLSDSSNGSSNNPGGVLIDKAATLVGTNLKDIQGASFDPVTHQLVFLGSANPGTLDDVNLPLFITAIQSVYGDATPPYVTLDPPAKLVAPQFNIGAGDGIVPNGVNLGIPIHYTPYASTPNDSMTLSFNLNGNPITVKVGSYLMNITAGSRTAVGLYLLSATGLPTGVTISMAPQNTFSGGNVLTINSNSQDSYFQVHVNNASGTAVTIDHLSLVTDLQHRKFGGRIDNTQLGWILEEADRVMKELAIGKDQLTGATYDSNNPSLPAGFESVLQRYLANNQNGNFANRFWFTPNEETLKRYIDPVTGQATVVFDKS